MTGFWTIPGAFVLAACTLALLFRWRDRMPHDRPNARSLHERPMLRVGGLSIWAGCLPVALAAIDAVPGGAVTLAAALAVVAVSLLDDWRGVRARTRLAVQLLAAAAAASVILDAQWAPTAEAHWSRWAGIAVATVAIAWSANLYNFMDGSDGLAAAMTIAGFASYGTAAWLAGAPPYAGWTVAAATLPLLAVNWPPARVFMGDVGAVPLGFLAATFGLAGWCAGLWPAWFPLLVFLPFIADASLTLVRRLLRRERVWEAHREHYYQRLHRLGAGHRGTLLCFGVLMTGTATSALFTLVRDSRAGWLVLGAWCAAFLLLCAGIDYHWKRRTPPTR